MKNILSIQSHVVYGHAGNSVSVFPMQLIGVNVWPLNSVQFSNHTQYGKWTGSVMPASHLIEIVEGIKAIDQLKKCNAVLSGYIGSKEQLETIIQIVREVKKANPTALYLLDPVMGNQENGCIVAPGIADLYCQHSLLLVTDIISLNFLELEKLSGRTIETVHQAITAARELCQYGVQWVLVKHLGSAGFNINSFEMLLVSCYEAWHTTRPLVDFGNQHPVGVGDLTSGLLLASILKAGWSKIKVLEYVTAAVYEVIKKTKEMDEYELQVVAAQNQIVFPQHHFTAQLVK